MSSDEREFLKAICANPADDTARLVYADWLEEHDQDERAEFIRVQIELHHMSADVPENCVPRWAELSARERELWELHGRNNPDWFPIYSLPRFVTVEPAGCEGLSGGNGDIEATPVRGFVERVELSAAAWIEYGDAIVASPLVTKVTLTTRPIATYRGDGTVRLWLREKSVKFSGRPEDTGLEDIVLALLKLEWPSVTTFELPPPVPPFTPPPVDMDTIEAYLRERRGIPAPQQP